MFNWLPCIFCQKQGEFNETQFFHLHDINSDGSLDAQEHPPSKGLLLVIHLKQGLSLVIHLQQDLWLVIHFKQDLWLVIYLKSGISLDQIHECNLLNQSKKFAFDSLDLNRAFDKAMILLVLDFNAFFLLQKI